ncbi:MAG: hypothetical protein QOE61_2192, partial [Micromonosporaceae bacterium]|nr:hypothetical protein [Micromonosporaceae bacterium]
MRKSAPQIEQEPQRMCGVPSAWLDQLAPHGRLVVPLRLRGSVSRS